MKKLFFVCLLVGCSLKSNADPSLIISDGTQTITIPVLSHETDFFGTFGNWDLSIDGQFKNGLTDPNSVSVAEIDVDAFSGTGVLTVTYTVDGYFADGIDEYGYSGTGNGQIDYTAGNGNGTFGDFSGPLSSAVTSGGEFGFYVPDSTGSITQTVTITDFDSGRMFTGGAWELIPDNGGISLMVCGLAALGMFSRLSERGPKETCRNG